MAINFQDVETMPAANRVENEFRDVIKFLAANRSAVKSYVIDVEGNTLEENRAQYEYDTRKMSEAGRELTPPVTVRTRVETLDDRKSLKVYMRATDKISRRRKTDAETTAATVPATVEKATPAKK
jgi:hypothetical protein